jgi:hypothetical protein
VSGGDAIDTDAAALEGGVVISIGDQLALLRRRLLRAGGDLLRKACF